MVSGAGSPVGLDAIRQAFGCGDALGRTIAALGREGGHGRGQVLYPLPDRDETSLIAQGRAQEVAYGRDGSMLVLHHLGPGEFYGSLAGASGESQVEATSEGLATHFNTAAVLRLMESYSCVALAISRQLAMRIAAMRRRMVETALLSATGRIASEVLRLAHGSADRTIRPMPVFSELAVSVQSTRETVSRTISQWEKRGLVKRVEGGLQVIAPHRLEELVY